MTEELEQKAEAEADKVIIGSGMDRASVIHLKHLLVTMYMQGATENGIQWHDLRKDPKDLPNDDRIVYVASLSPYEAKENVFDYMFDSWLGDDWFYNAVNDVIAWCENPQFKE